MQGLTTAVPWDFVTSDVLGMVCTFLTLMLDAHAWLCSILTLLLADVVHIRDPRPEHYRQAKVAEVG